MSYHVTILKTAQRKRIPLQREEVERIALSMNLSVLPAASNTLEIEFSNVSGAKAMLIWQDGEIWTRNPAKETLAVMISLADKLGARVRGDEFETYNSPEQTYDHPDDEMESKCAKHETERIVAGTKRNQWTLNAIVFGTFLLLALLVAYLSRTR